MMIKNKKLVCGVGYNDLNYISNKEVYKKWSNMINRCYDSRYHSKHPTYIGCAVCDEWKLFSNFKKWFDVNSRVGMQLDKDILVRGNKIYCPEYCRFVPVQINTLLTDSYSSRGLYMQGVTLHKPTQKYLSYISRCKGREHIGTYDTEQEAFDAYKFEKEKWIKTQADYYFNLGLIDKDIHTALYNWSI